VNHHVTCAARRVLSCMALLCCACLLLAGCESKSSEELVRVDSEKEANRVLVELESRGIKQAQKVEKSEQRKTLWSITVLPADVAAARNILVQCDLPRERHGGFASMAESSSLIPTKNEERAKLMHAFSGELERTFETYDRVVSARVHIVLPVKDPLSRDSTTKPTASAMVLIKYIPRAVEETATTGKQAYADAPVSMEEVQQMVARSVEGLTMQNVFVTYTKSPPREMAVAASSSSTPLASAAVTPVATASSAPADKKLVMQLFGAVAVFGVIAIFLTTLLVREKRRQRLAAQ
jgi:type III secretion protein J